MICWCTHRPGTVCLYHEGYHAGEAVRLAPRRRQRNLNTDEHVARVAARAAEIGAPATATEMGQSERTIHRMTALARARGLR